MPACNKIRKIIAIGILSLQAGTFLAAQQVTMPEMPEMPDMPSVGGTFYHPEMPQFKIPGQNSTQKTDDTSVTGATISSAQNSTDEILQQITGSSNLTASDISSLYSSGLFSDLSSLGVNSSLLNSTSTNSTDVLLQQVLTSLNELKTQQKNASPEEKLSYADSQKDQENFRKRDPSILRFQINGYNIKDSLTTVFFSEPEADGSFLLTGDRKYFTSQKMRTETFYLLFKTIKSNGSSTTYQVVPSVVQDSKNENSFVYKMSQFNNLTAEKTGNLVVIHFTKNDFAMDLLLDIDNRSY